MIRQWLFLKSFTLILALFPLALPARSASRPQPVAPSLSITKVALGQQGDGCTGAEIDCIDVAWEVSGAEQLGIKGFDITIKVAYESGANVGRKTVSSAARSAKVGIFHQGSGALKSFQVSVTAFRLTATGSKQTVLTATKTGNF